MGVVDGSTFHDSPGTDPHTSVICLIIINGVYVKLESSIFKYY